MYINKYAYGQVLLEDIMVEKIVPFHWSWEPKIVSNGDVYVTLTERTTGSGGALVTMRHVFAFSHQKMTDFIKGNCHYNKFAQIHYEGHLSRDCEKRENQIREMVDDSIGIIISENPPFTLSQRPNKNGETVALIAEHIAFNHALLAIFRNSVNYDSPCGGGRNGLPNVNDIIRNNAESSFYPSLVSLEHLLPGGFFYHFSHKFVWNLL